MGSLTVNCRIRVQKDVAVHIRRAIPAVLGSVKVKVGQEVCPEDVLGEGQVPAGFRVIHLARDLRVSPKEAMSYLKRQIGKNIYQGELLAAKARFFGKKILVSPIDGVIDFYDEQKGDLRVKLLPKLTKLVSGVYGIIDHIDTTSNTITIRTQITLVYGVLGLGKEREGILKVIGGTGDLISSRQISTQMHGEILIGGGIVFLDALEKAVNLNVAGIITGGIDAKDYRVLAGSNWSLPTKRWSDVGITMMATEGFGASPIGEDIYTAIRKHHGKFVIFDGNLCRLILPSTEQNSMIYIRRVKLPKISYPQLKPDLSLANLQVGAIVRLLSIPSLGIQGVVGAIDHTPTRLPSGITTTMVTVVTRLRKIRVPYNNLEVVG